MAKVTLCTFVPLASSSSSFVCSVRSRAVLVLPPVFACAWFRTFSFRSCRQLPIDSHQPVLPVVADCRFSSRSTVHLPRSRAFFRWSAAPVMSSTLMRLAPYTRSGSFTVYAPVMESVALSPSSTIPVPAMFGLLFVP